MKKLILGITISITFISCGNKTGNENLSPVVIKAATTDTIASENKTEEYVGTLVTERFWGAPGFGEDTLNDAKEIQPVLLLDEKIELKISDNSSDIVQVEKMQLIHLEDYKNLKGKHVIVKGTTFSAETGHHHTDMLIDVSEIKEIK